MEEYAYIREQILIKKDIYEISLIVDDKNSRKGERLYTINEDALNIIKRFTGEFKLKEIIEQLSNYYNEDFNEIKIKLLNFLNMMKNNFNLEVEYSKCKLHREIKTIINQNPYFPRAITIELTHRCNFKCLHCYGEYDNESYETMDFDKLKKFILECKEIGVDIIELTGGEITMHPEVAKVLDFIHTVGFKLVTVLTNGFVRNEELYNIIIENKQNTVVQIDMHGNTEEYLTWFTKVPNTKKKVEENIKYLSDNGVHMRVVTVVTPQNLDQIENIADWVYSLGIKSYAVSPVVPTGRANNDSSELLINSVEDMDKFQKALSSIAEKYGKKFLNIVESEEAMNASCGGLVSNPTITPKGDIKICAVDNLNYFNSIGNVFEESIKSLYESSINYVKQFKNLKSPKMDSEGCKDCEHIQYCYGCVLRAVSRGLEKGDDCHWLRDIVPVEIKNRMKDTVVVCKNV